MTPQLKTTGPRSAGLFGGVLLAFGAQAGEPDYQLPWCEARGGIAEYVLPDRTRVDCLTETHLIEFDFASKWAEAIGQALYYASQAQRRAAVVSILRDPREEPPVRRNRETVGAGQLRLDIWPIWR